MTNDAGEPNVGAVGAVVSTTKAVAEYVELEFPAKSVMPETWMVDWPSSPDWKVTDTWADVPEYELNVTVLVCPLAVLITTDGVLVASTVSLNVNPIVEVFALTGEAVPIVKLVIVGLVKSTVTVCVVDGDRFPAESLSCADNE